MSERCGVVPWYAALPCVIDCGRKVGHAGAYVTQGVHFCATCLPFVVKALEERGQRR